MSRKSVLAICLSVIVSISAFSVFAGDSSEFPHREKYKELTFLTTEEFNKIADKAIVIDARNTTEYNVLHMAGSINHPEEKMKKSDLKKLRAEDGDRPIVFYCNGNTCEKSYKGGKKAHIWGWKNTFVYDSGIFTWSKFKPKTVEFFGAKQTAESLEKNLIPKSEFKKRCLSPGDFISKVNSGDFKFFDVRDRSERNEFKFKIPGLAKMSLDQFATFMTKGKAIPDSNLLIADGKGKQVAWIEYYLVKHGKTNYYFLDGGVREWRAKGFDASGTKATSMIPGNNEKSE